MNYGRSYRPELPYHDLADDHRYQKKQLLRQRIDLVTAVFLSREDYDASGLRSLDERSLLVLESATAEEEIPTIGVRRGDQYIRMRAKPDHGLIVGEEIQLDSMQ